MLTWNVLYIDAVNSFNGSMLYIVGMWLCMSPAVPVNNSALDDQQSLTSRGQPSHYLCTFNNGNQAWVIVIFIILCRESL